MSPHYHVFSDDSLPVKLKQNGVVVGQEFEHDRKGATVVTYCVYFDVEGWNSKSSFKTPGDKLVTVFRVYDAAINIIRCFDYESISFVWCFKLHLM